MAVLFVIAPVQIYYRVLPLIEEKKFKKLTVITTKELEPFFKEHTNAEVIVPKVHPNLITRKNKSKIIGNLIKAKLEYRRIFKNIENEEIYFFFTAWALLLFYYINNLSKKNKVYLYRDSENSYEMYKEEKSIRASMMKFFSRLFLGLKINVISKEGTPVWLLPENSFPMTVISARQDEKLVNKYLSDTSFLKGKNTLFIGDNIDIEGADEDSVINLSDNIIDIFNKKFKNSYVIKPHPREQKLYGKMANSKNVISPYILAETIMGHDWKFIVGYYSEALISARKLTNAKVISLLHLFNWGNKELKEYWQKRMKKEGLFIPESLQEFKEIIKG